MNDVTPASRRAAVAAELADFSQYPPEKNTLEGTCLVDRGYVGRGAGVIVLGRDELGRFAGYLHADCAARVAADQEAAVIAV